MPDRIDYQITGLPEVVGKLIGLPIALRAKGIRFAGRRAANIIQDAAVANALRLDDPTTSEQIAKNIVVRFSNRRFRQTGDVMFRIGVLGGARNYEAYGEITTGKKASENPGGDTWYWRFKEFGTEKVAATPFMRPALEQKSGEATDEFVKQLDKWLDRNLKRISKKGL